MMTAQDTRERVLVVLKESYPRAIIGQTWEAIGMDSLDYIDFIMNLEKQFNCEIPDMLGFNTPLDIVHYLEAKCTSK